MGKGGFVLIAENVENIGLRTGLDKAIAAVCSQGKLDVIARRRIFNGELLFDLTKGREHQRKPKRCKQNLSPHAD